MNKILKYFTEDEFQEAIKSHGPEIKKNGHTYITRCKPNDCAIEIVGDDLSVYADWFEFEDYYFDWRIRSCVMSSAQAIYDLDSYKAMADMKLRAVPFIYEKLCLENSAFFLCRILEELFPNVIVTTGYIPPLDYKNAWLLVLNAVITGDNNLHLEED